MEDRFFDVRHESERDAQIRSDIRFLAGAICVMVGTILVTNGAFASKTDRSARSMFERGFDLMRTKQATTLGELVEAVLSRFGGQHAS